MPDTLIIAGQTFENVAGFKAIDSANLTQTYIKPSGSISVSSNGIYDINVYASVEVAIPYASGVSF